MSKKNLKKNPLYNSHATLMRSQGFCQLCYFSYHAGMFEVIFLRYLKFQGEILILYQHMAQNCNIKSGKGLIDHPPSVSRRDDLVVKKIIVGSEQDRRNQFKNHEENEIGKDTKTLKNNTKVKKLIFFRIQSSSVIPNCLKCQKKT